ncbi:MAG TPA: hypothetical protein VER04_24360 [Polyangiaceae bacterium]|nr:hypothetical protein [Polyangiaceae bacterium]
MNVTIIHIGGTEKLCSFESFDAPRPWIRLRYPNGGGVWSFALAHGGIEAKRGTMPEWRISDADLATLRAEAKALDIKFTVVPFARSQRVKPGAPRKKTPQKQMGLFEK